MRTLTKEQRYILREVISKEIESLEYHLESLSIDDYRINGHNIEDELDDLEAILCYLNGLG